MQEAHEVYFQLIHNQLNQYIRWRIMPDLKNPWIKRAGILVAILPFMWIFHRLDFHKMLADVPTVAWWAVPLVFAGTLATMITQGTRWWLLLRAFTDEIPFLRALSYHFMSIYYSTVLPTSAGQEVLRTLFVLKKAGAAVGWGAAWVCKITALMLSLLFSVYGLTSLSKGSLPHVMIMGIFGFFLLIILLGVISFSKGLTAPVRRLAASIIPAKILGVVENIREGDLPVSRQKKGDAPHPRSYVFSPGHPDFQYFDSNLGHLREDLLLGVSRLYTAYRDREHVGAIYAQRHGNP